MSTVSRTVNNYRQLNTVPALTGVVFSIAAAVQYLGAEMSIEYPSAYTFPGEHAMLVGLLCLLLAFASSDTKDWRYYDQWEQAAVAIAVVGSVLVQYVPEVNDLLVNNQPVSGVVMFVASLAAWAILAR